MKYIKQKREKRIKGLVKHMLALSALVLTLTATVNVTYADANNKCGKHATWEYDKTSDTLTIKGSGRVDYTKKMNKCKAKKLVIEKGITIIGDSAFADMEIKEVTIPNTVKEIEYEAFAYSYLKSVKLGSGVKKIGWSVFSQCKKLKKVEWNAKKIPGYAFSNCKKLETVKLGKKVRSIGERAFNKTAIADIKLSKTIKYIGSGAFRGCRNLEKLTIPGSVKKVRRNLVSNTDNLQKVTLEDGVTQIDSYAFEKCGAKEIVIPQSVSRIKKNAFRNANYLESVVIPDSIRRIADETFYGCDNLKSVKFGKNVLAIGENVFTKCHSLGNVTIPGTVHTIEYKAFENSGCTNVTIENGVRTLDYWAFANCNKLVSVSIPKSVTSIARNSFAACKKLTTMNIDAKNPAYSTDKYCLLSKDGTNLITVWASAGGTFDIPEKVSTIEVDAFRGCSNLTAFATTKNKNFTTQDGILYNNTKWLLVKCPMGKTGTVVVPNGVTKIGPSAFSQSSATAVIIPNTVRTLGYCAFEYCNNISTITIPGSVRKVSNACFWGCKKLKKVVIEKGVKKICKNSFHDCDKLKKISIPFSVTYINKSAFNFYSDVTFYCEKSSVAMSFAVRRYINYKEI